MKQLLTTPDPLCSEGRNLDCCPEQSTGGKGDWKKPGVLYRHVCMAPTCTADGKVMGRCKETGKTGFVRGKQHFDKIQVARKNRSKADLDNGLVVHNLDFHEGEQPNYRMDVKKSFKNPTQKQIAEAVAIHGSKDTVVMNTKHEWV